MYDLTEIINYYVNLLIIQYHDRPKAKSEIELFVKELFADGLIFELQNAFEIDTAVGIQLDILGEYVGVDRILRGYLVNRQYFQLATYTDAGINKIGFRSYIKTRIEGEV